MFSSKRKKKKVKGKGKQGKETTTKKETTNITINLGLCVTGDHSELDLPASLSYPSLTAPACGAAPLKPSAAHQHDLKCCCGETPPFGLGHRAMKHRAKAT